MNSIAADALFANVVGAGLSSLALTTTIRLGKYEGYSAGAVTGIVWAILLTLLWFIGFMSTFNSPVWG